MHVCGKDYNLVTLVLAADKAKLKDASNLLKHLAMIHRSIILLLALVRHVFQLEERT